MGRIPKTEKNKLLNSYEHITNFGRTAECLLPMELSNQGIIASFFKDLTFFL